MLIDRKSLDLLTCRLIDSFLQKQKECRQRTDLGFKTQKTVFGQKNSFMGGFIQYVQN
jgi:hypothetical protein